IVVSHEQDGYKDILAWARATREGLPFDPKRPKYEENFEDLTVRVVSKPVAVGPGKPAVEHKFLLYHGPVKVRLLGQFSGVEQVDPDLVERYQYTLHLRTLTDYRSAGWPGTVSKTIGWNWLLIQCTNLMHGLLGFLHGIIPS